MVTRIEILGKLFLGPLTPWPQSRQSPVGQQPAGTAREAVIRRSPGGFGDSAGVTLRGSSPGCPECGGVVSSQGGGAADSRYPKPVQVNNSQHSTDRAGLGRAPTGVCVSQLPPFTTDGRTCWPAHLGRSASAFN
jgi:hypothetical protein